MNLLAGGTRKPPDSSFGNSASQSTMNSVGLFTM
jgi:hypothetical protein